MPLAVPEAKPPSPSASSHSLFERDDVLDARTGGTVSAVVVPGRACRERRGTAGQLGGGTELPGREEPLERDLPALVVAPLAPLRPALPLGDGGDQVLPELVPVENARLMERHGQAEEPALQRRGEDQLAVLSGRG